MEKWRERLAGIDDDYLIGLSNKGTVKRAYKDMEEGLSGGEAAAKIGALGDEAVVKVGAETVTVRFPLGESKCTCPSRSICRHVVHAILALRKSCLETGKAEEMAQHPQEPPAIAPEAIPHPQEPPAPTPESIQDAAEATKQDAPRKPGQPEPQAAQSQDSLRIQDSPAWKEINDYPMEKLKKALGSRYFQSFAAQASSGIRPMISSSSVITVRLPEQDSVVKLLSPLEYSTCTCHKKELCRHKAAAILWCQLEAGTLAMQTLEEQTADVPAYDLEETRAAAGQMKEFLEELLGTGLSRVSPDVSDYLERLAIISHNARLSRFEGYFRALADSYGRYFARKASFQTEDLLGQLTRLYRRAELLEQTQNQAEVAKLAGEFRADYLPVGSLDLIGIAMECFRSQNGYEGETIYFLEEKTKQWYTYTNARPMFYDDPKRKGYARKSQQAASPWGLNISLEKLLTVRIHLEGAKCGGRGRLSSSQETRGEVTGDRRLDTDEIEKWYYRDFGELFRNHIQKQQRPWLTEQAGPEGSPEGTQGQSGSAVELVFVQPADCAKAEFSETEQKLTLPLYDSAGRELLVEVGYSREESGNIRYLERISGKNPPCFLGKVYLRDGRLRMYPVDLLDKKELAEGMQASSAPGEKTSTEAGVGSAPGEKTSTEAGARSAPREQAAAEAGTATGEQPPALPAAPRPKFTVMKDLAREIGLLMEDLCQSGFTTVHDSTLKDIQSTAELTAQYGCQHLSSLLAALGEKIAANRHRMQQENKSLAGLYTDINEYLYIFNQKNEYNRGESYYK